MVLEIFDKVNKNIPLSYEGAVELLSIKNLSTEYYELLKLAGDLSKKEYGNKGYIFVQIGLNYAPCSGNCTFCSLAECNSTFNECFEKPVEELLSEISTIDFDKVTAVFLMTTADYDKEKFLEVGEQVRKIIPSDIALVANTGDFDLEYALRMKACGFTGAYHVVRLREGKDTALTPEKRIASLDAVRDAGLRLYYCIEPIGPEHSYEELATEMMRAKDYHVDVMAAMRRVCVSATAFEGREIINDFELAKIVAVTRLVVKPKVSMNVHEPNITAMLGGVNQLYAELGVNPRDDSMDTENSRGWSIKKATVALEDAGFPPCVEGRK